MMIEALHSLLIGSSAIVSLVDSRIYPIVLPTDGIFPAITYQRISSIPTYSLSSNVGVTTSRMEIDAWASTYQSAHALADAILSAIDNYSGTASDGTRIFGIQLDNSTDIAEERALLYRVRMEFLIQHS